MQKGRFTTPDCQRFYSQVLCPGRTVDLATSAGTRHAQFLWEPGASVLRLIAINLIRTKHQLMLLGDLMSGVLVNF
jgi:hypothetical protein